ncbi:DUF434 domain-containing protein [Thermosulfurimonas sp. F29]|uniref:DUF434 domain-containing protein n=1 Tax=Thermosulfurimonas sp. F29 TaxID=2867247 RepID=UPI001C83D64D|nr:DUF434 domain-containing protein [Thermosulfurimonas sp. F29]MBX6422510.1 DUF434 domain-containing protein [Thermosulfurimonas sp. F29]
MERLIRAARDFAWLLDRGYPERAALKLVGDRYDLNTGERELVLRGTVPREVARCRREKRVRPGELVGASVAVDGYNVLATLAHALRRRPLVLARDGFVRDAERAGPRLCLSPELPRLEALLLGFLRRYRPAFLGFYLDAPVSGSGELAARLRRSLLEPLGIPGEVLALRDAETRVLEAAVVCTADGALVDRARRVFDLAGHLIVRTLRHPLLRPFP